MIKKYGRNGTLTIKRIHELEQNDKISFGIIGIIDRELNEVRRLIFWLFSQQKTNKYRFDNYLGRGYEGIAKALGISEVEACELILKKLTMALTLGFETVINKEIERKLKLMKTELKWAKGRAKEEVLKND